MSKKIFIVGASYLQLPAIIKAKEMGLEVAVADMNPEAIGVSYADKFYNVSTIDEKGIYEASKDFGADGITTLATDMPMRAVAYATSKLGLNGISYDTAIKSTDKGEMIKTFKEKNVSHPWFFILNDKNHISQIINKIVYPCISKPLDSSGSRGVVLIKDASELMESILYSFEYSRKNGIIIEEYLEGKEVSVEIIVENGTVHILAVTDKITTGSPYFVEMGHSQPSQISDIDVRNIKNLASKAVLALGIINGPAHVEIMLTKNGPKIIEVGARLGGDFITTHLVPLSTGIDMVKAVINLACGEKIDIIPKFEKGSAIRFLSSKPGVINKIDGLENAKQVDGVIEAEILKNIGEESKEICNSHDRLGYVIAQGNSAVEAINNCEKAISNIFLDI